jgi:AAA domain
MTTDDIRAKLDAVKAVGPQEWKARCPAHEDRTPSLWIKAVPGRTLVHDFGNCDPKKVVAALGLTMGDLFDDDLAGRLTLDRFARAKRLPLDFLAPYVEELDAGLLFRYRLADGSPAPRQRLRLALWGKDQWRWQGSDQDPIVAYGLQDLAVARETGTLDVGEGESDWLTLKYYGIPALGLPGSSLVKTLTAEMLEGIHTLFLNQEPGPGGVGFITGCRNRLREIGWAGSAGVVKLRTAKDVNDLHCADPAGFREAYAQAKQTAVRLSDWREDEPDLRREGLDLVLAWPGAVEFHLAAIRDGRDGVRGELTVRCGGRRVSWSAWSLPSAQARESLRKKLEATDPEVPWADYLDETAYRLTQAAREGEPLVTLTGQAAPPSRELMRNLLYEGESTQVYGDGDTGKSLFALAVAFAVQAGLPLPAGLCPARAVPVAYLDWETTEATLNHRLGLIAAGFRVDPPPILYKRMRRPLVDEAASLAAEFARRRIRLVIVDSLMYAVASLEGSGYHEVITAFYTALRLFAPAASLVLNHLTNVDARGTGPTRPFGGAFAFNAPRLSWEARRDQEVTEATVITFTCKKGNELIPRAEPFGLQFTPEAGRTQIAISQFDLSEAAPETLAKEPLRLRLGLELGQGPQSVAALAQTLNAEPDQIRRILNRFRDRQFVPIPHTNPPIWALTSRRRGG